MVVQRSARRPIDKSLVIVNKTAVDGTQVATTLLTATFPCTVTGIRWSMGAIADAGTAISQVRWAIVLVKDGLSASTMASSDGASLYDPEQNVLAFGYAALNDAAQGSAMPFQGETKTMRKLMGGDKLQFIVASEATNTV